MVFRIPVTIHSIPEKFLIVCETGHETIQWLCEKAYKIYTEKYHDKTVPYYFVARRSYDRCLLSLDDHIEHVLKDNESIEIDIAKQFDDDDSLSTATDEERHVVLLDGYHLKCSDLVRLGTGDYQIELPDETWNLIHKAREIVDHIITNKKVVYGVNTGFGSFASTIISDEKLADLQTRLIVSHCAGVGEPLTIERARMMFALRINILAKGYSGISEDTLHKIITAFNKSCIPEIPSQGTVGASGDLAPLAHLAAGLMGVGRMWSPKTGWGNANDVLAQNGLDLIEYKPKEGLTMINGTQFITALGAEAVERAILIARQADIIAALSTEALRGTVRHLHPNLHASRPHVGQNLVAERLRALLSSPLYPSAISESHANCGRVQDAYSIRCVPQIHGISWDTIKFVKKIITTEMNSATDNPLVFTETDEVVSGGNFHGEYPAKALDYLAIGVHEIGSLSACRMERLVNHGMSGLPAFLTLEGGLNSGFMIAHCTAAALVSEDKVLCHPSSVDSISTSAGQEDHVSMGGWSARKALKVIDNVEIILAIELLMACQAIDLLYPLTSTPPLQAIHTLVRQSIATWDKDRFMSHDIETATRIVKSGVIWKTAQPYIQNYHNYYYVEHHGEPLPKAEILMKLIYVFILQLEIIMIMMIYAKNYSASELNRLRITKRYRNHLLIRSSMKNITQTIVSIGLGIIEIEGINPHQQVITLNVNFELKWCDDRLLWNTSEQLCLSKRNRSAIFFTANEIWTPDIVAINGPGKTEKEVKYQYPILALCSGIVRWSYQDKLVSYCEINVQNFPFDKQYCTILLQSTIYDSNELKLRSLYKVVQLYNFINTEWKIIHATIEELDLYNPYYERYFSTIKINIELVRLSRFYVGKIIFPFSIISSLGLFSFCLPTDSNEKITLTVSVLLSLTIYLQLISDYVPKNERGLCTLTLYSNIIFSLVFLSCLFNILTIFIYYYEEYFLRNKISKKTFLFTIHQSLIELNKKRQILFKKCRNNQKYLSKHIDINALEILHDIKYIRELLKNLLIRENFVDYRHNLFYPQRSIKQLAVFVDRILFFIYLISMPLTLIILFKANSQSNILPTTKNQLLDLRKISIDPAPVYRGCPT
ncbi:unnamed protein product [Rotaria sp. Silwood1]|nr:unnamed protein product [Rotaria sp. Silwood1]CAF1192059.1 unnamed protein product [Rotaria sp. Silwood1]